MNLTPTHERASTPRPPIAPLQIEFRFQLNVPPSEAFELVSTRMSEWFSAIHAVTWDHAKSTRGPTTLGSCSERVCDFGGKALVESIVEFEPGSRYAYSVDMARSQMKMPLQDHYATFEVEAAGEGSLITWRTHFRALWFVPAAMLRWQMRDKMMRPALDGLIRKVGGEWVSVK